MRRFASSTILWLGLAAVLWSVPAAGKIPLCVSTAGFESQSAADYQRMVSTEIRRHAHHTPVKAGCNVTLHVELLNVKPTAYVTGYLDGQVPTRVSVNKSGDVPEAISRLVAKVLESDPAAWVRQPGDYLEQVLVSDAGLKRGVMLFGMEAFQHLTRTGKGPTTLPGLGARIRRGIGPVQVGARLSLAYLPRNPGPTSDPQMSLMASLEPEVAWYASSHAASSFYLAGSLGLTVFRFDGFGEGQESLVDVGVSLGARAGVELLRVHDFRLDLFVQAQLPCFISDSPESNIVDAYTPGIQIGGGIAF